MKRGEIYRASLDPTVGREQQGYRPLLVITHEDFNRLTSLPVILPITNGGAFARRIGYAVPLNGWACKQLALFAAISRAFSTSMLAMQLCRTDS